MRAILVVLGFAISPLAFSYDWNTGETKPAPATSFAVEQSVFQGLMAGLDGVKIEIDGRYITLTRFLSELITANPRSAMTVKNKCTVRTEGQGGFECRLTLELVKPPKARAEIASYQLLYRTTGQADAGLHLDPNEVYLGRSRDGLRTSVEYESAALTQLLSRLSQVKLADQRVEPLPEFLAEDLLNKKRVAYVRHRCRAVETVEKPECALTLFLYRAPRKLEVEQTYTLIFNASADETAGVGLPGRVKKVEHSGLIAQ